MEPTWQMAVLVPDTGAPSKNAWELLPKPTSITYTSVCPRCVHIWVLTARSGMVSVQLADCTLNTRTSLNAGADAPHAGAAPSHRPRMAIRARLLALAFFMLLTTPD